MNLSHKKDIWVMVNVVVNHVNNVGLLEIKIEIKNN